MQILRYFLVEYSTGRIYRIFYNNLLSIIYNKIIFIYSILYLKFFTFFTSTNSKQLRNASTENAEFRGKEGIIMKTNYVSTVGTYNENINVKTKNTIFCCSSKNKNWKKICIFAIFVDNINIRNMHCYSYELYTGCSRSCVFIFFREWLNTLKTGINAETIKQNLDIWRNLIFIKFPRH